MSGAVSGSGSLDLAYRIGRTITVDLGTIAINKAAVDAVNALTITVSGGTGLAALFSGASISCPGSGLNSERFGSGAICSFAGGTALGNSATAGQSNSVAVGLSSSAGTVESIAIGSSASTTTGNQNIAIGASATASGGNVTGIGGAVAIGYSSWAPGTQAVAVGISATASSTDSIAIGNGASATTGVGNIAIGHGALSIGAAGTIAVGNGAQVGSGSNSIALGSSAFANAARAIAIGGSTSAFADAIALGTTTTTRANQLATTCTEIALGGTTSSFPLIKRSSTGIQLKLADDSATAPLNCGVLVTIKTQAASPYTVTTPESRTVYTNEGTTAQVEFDLPTAAAGYSYTFVVQDTDGIKVVANAGDTIRIGGSVSAAAGNIVSTTIGSTVTLVAINATEWVAISTNGTWTVT